MRPGLAKLAGLACALFAASGLANAAAALPEARLSPAEVAALPRQAGGAGTSGLTTVRTTVLTGDPSAPGPYVIALVVPPHTIIAAHTHRDDRTATVVSGTWWFGYGLANTPDQLRALKPGSFYTEPGGRAHFARTGDEPAVVYITGVGPTDTVYSSAPAAKGPR